MDADDTNVTLAAFDMQSLNDKIINVNVEGVKINQTDHSKGPGLNIDENLSRKEHIHTISKRTFYFNAYRY